MGGGAKIFDSDSDQTIHVRAETGARANAIYHPGGGGSNCKIFYTKLYIQTI